VSTIKAAQHNFSAISGAEDKSARLRSVRVMNILDVPFHSSGAINRSHYAIVRRVETATSIPTADQQIFLEIKAVQEKLHLGLSTVGYEKPFSDNIVTK